MKNTRSKHSAAFKTKVVLEVIKEQKTLSELAQEYQLTPAQISSWMAELLANAQSLFGETHEQAESIDKEKEELHNQIGRLKAENDWLKKKVAVVPVAQCCTWIEVGNWVVDSSLDRFSQRLRKI